LSLVADCWYWLLVLVPGIYQFTGNQQPATGNQQFLMRLLVNGREHDVAPEPVESLADTLRDRLHLTGTKVSCGRGECGSCTVLLDGRVVYSCLTITNACAGAVITTIEGPASPGELHPMQRAFIEHDAVQCGFCTPGQVLAAVALLSSTPVPDESDIQRAMSGNLCRCGTYPRIAQAIRAVSGRPEAQ
jgi:aerobic-type carbon monoxide dehydrogenase small subunit (CoxS/CutS family)